MSQIQLPNNTGAPHLADNKIKLMQVQGGMMGRFFGVGENAKLNVLVFALFLVLFVGGISSALVAEKHWDSVGEIWKYLTPICTALVGAIIGKHL